MCCPKHTASVPRQERSRTRRRAKASDSRSVAPPNRAFVSCYGNLLSSTGLEVHKLDPDLLLLSQLDFKGVHSPRGRTGPIGDSPSRCKDTVMTRTEENG